ncbi:FluC/FEX family fluoride channel [Bifidobacterium dentium]|uniref:FluC/FEX family fluoride channel n=1 Tax=Bifidobacterium dentium TaxID=1689 RepID=UPI003A4E07DF
MSRQHIIRWDLMGVVFVGGCIGTGLRYACSFIADYGAFHFGTFTANMIACFAYATYPHGWAVPRVLRAMPRNT